MTAFCGKCGGSVDPFADDACECEEYVARCVAAQSTCDECDAPVGVVCGHCYSPVRS